MVGYGANKVKHSKLRVSSQYLAKKFSRELQKTTTLTKNTKFNSRWWRFIMRGYRIYWYQLQKDQSKVIKSESIKLSEFMLKVCLSILWTLMSPLRSLCKKELGTDQLQLLKWMQAQVEPIQLSRSNLNRLRSLEAKKDKNYQLFIWLTWLEVKKLEKQGLLEIDWKRLPVLTRAYQCLVSSSVL